MTGNRRTEAETAALPAPIEALLASRTAGDLNQAVEAIVREREHRLFVVLGRLARDLHESARGLARAIASGEGDTRDVPAARRRLDEALGMSEDAAHRSLDVGERLLRKAGELERAAGAVADACDPPAQDRQTPADRMAETAAAFAESCREDIRELMLAQSWQDLTGQRMQQVAGFLARIEGSILDLVRLAGSIGAPESEPRPSQAQRLATQEQVDRLLNETGF